MVKDLKAHLKLSNFDDKLNEAKIHLQLEIVFQFHLELGLILLGVVDTGEEEILTVPPDHPNPLSNHPDVELLPPLLLLSVFLFFQKFPSKTLSAF